MYLQGGDHLCYYCLHHSGFYFLAFLLFYTFYPLWFFSFLLLSICLSPSAFSFFFFIFCLFSTIIRLFFSLHVSLPLPSLPCLSLLPIFFLLFLLIATEGCSWQKQAQLGSLLVRAHAAADRARNMEQRCLEDALRLLWF